MRQVPLHSYLQSFGALVHSLNTAVGSLSVLFHVLVGVHGDIPLAPSTSVGNLDKFKALGRTGIEATAQANTKDFSQQINRPKNGTVFQPSSVHSTILRGQRTGFSGKGSNSPHHVFLQLLLVLDGGVCVWNLTAQDHVTGHVLVTHKRIAM